MRRMPVVFCLLLSAAPAFGWGAHGHRIVTKLALDGLPADMPGWLRDEKVRDQVAYQSSEPDRWRGTRLPALTHENDPDHYLDIELLEQFGLTLETVPPLRYEYLRAMAISKHTHPEKVAPYDAGKDPARSKEWPGFALHSIAEHYAKLRSAFSTLKTLEKMNDPSRAAQLEMARANVIYHMGVLSHFVGDIAQPLHTTKHFNGWEGDNPNNYTTSRKFHGYLDTGILFDHRLTYEMLKPGMKYEARVNREDPWADVLVYISRAFDKVETVYRMDRDGELKSEPGKELICERLRDAGSFLSAMYAAAWNGAAVDEKQVRDFLRYDEPGGEKGAKPEQPEAKPGE